jgi:hypothetical protein
MISRYAKIITKTYGLRPILSTIPDEIFRIQAHLSKKFRAIIV